MCRWLRDILFPTNVLGKKKRCAKYISASDYTASLDIELESTNPNIFNGDFVVSWVERDPLNPESLIRRKKRFTEKDDGDIIYLDVQAEVMDRTFYFNCTNLVWLSVDGEFLFNDHDI